ncbi:hypothetical protein [Pseudomonas congelans]|uniref:hypothetical protein n=1 Tax=Pseudomonas congelans TaxID=200452 RepID=UPI000B09DFCF|nr:hypothetical protein [Pseudomonas congelans]
MGRSALDFGRRTAEDGDQIAVATDYLERGLHGLSREASRMSGHSCRMRDLFVVKRHIKHDQPDAFAAPG